MEKRMNKKAQDLSIGTLILIVLGIVVLVILIVGFTMGWGNLWDRLTGVGVNALTVDDVVNSCETILLTDAVYNYCNTFNEVKINNQKQWISCDYSGVKSRLSKTLDCSKDYDEAEIQQCANQKLKDDDLVNGKTCKQLTEITCKELGQKRTPKAATRDQTIAKGNDCPQPGNNERVETITNGFTDSDTSVCCLYFATP